MKQPIKFTQEGFEKIKKEREELVSSKKEKAIDRLSKARAMGDLSENSEYTAAKEELAFLEGRVRELDEMLRNAQIVAKSTSESTVDIGSEVIVDINGKKDTFYIVGDFEANPMEKRLSQTSPIGKALFGKKTGEVVEITVPAGTMMYKIIEVKNS